jgi:hypothetical protein
MPSLFATETASGEKKVEHPVPTKKSLPPHRCTSLAAAFGDTAVPRLVICLAGQEIQIKTSRNENSLFC